MAFSVSASGTQIKLMKGLNDWGRILPKFISPPKVASHDHDLAKNILAEFLLKILEDLSFMTIKVMFHGR